MAANRPMPADLRLMAEMIEFLLACVEPHKIDNCTPEAKDLLWRWMLFSTGHDGWQ